MSEATRTPDVSFGSPASSDAPDKNGYVAVTKSEYVTHHALNTVIPSCKVNQVKSYVGGSVEDRTKIYKESIEQNDTFWSHIARRDFYWHRYWPDDKHVKSYNFHRSRGPVHVQWFEGSQTNVCYNAIDRHLPQHKDRVCLYFEGNFVHQTRKITYGEMHAEVVQLANVLRTQYGVKRGDRVSMYLPMIPCAATVMLACARIGAVVSVIFAGFSSQALVSRLIDAKPSLLITADVSFRGDKPILLKSIADVALLECASKGLDLPCLVYSNGEEKRRCSMTAPRDVWYSDAVAQLTAEQRTDCPVEWMDAEDPLFILYTSGSTGTPKALVHTTAGYMVYAATTFKYTFDYHLDDVYFCTADVGWITGHSYVVYGPMINCATSVLYEGVPTFPTPSRWWTLVEKYAVSIFYTAPTAIRTLMKYGDEAVQKCDRRSLRILGSVGEPINVEAWMWLYEVVGERHVDVVDTFWQTETGGHMITPLPGCTPLKPGSASLPFFGVVPVLLDPVTLREIEGEGEGLLSISQPWPGIARTLYEQHDRFEQVYFSADGYYTTGDGARRDADGFIWITGRVDDVLNVSGHRISTSEIEDAVNSHHAVVESAAVGIPHDVKGESIYVYVVFHDGTEITRELLQQIKTTVRHVIGPLATPDHVQPAQSGLPKTRSGKIMRRVLRKIATRKDDEIGDTSTLADERVVKALITSRNEWTRHF